MSNTNKFTTDIALFDQTMTSDNSPNKIMVKELNIDSEEENIRVEKADYLSSEMAQNKEQPTVYMTKPSEYDKDHEISSATRNSARVGD